MKGMTLAKFGDISLPVYMRVGDGEEYEVGKLSLAVTPETSHEGGVLSVTVSPEPVAPKLAGLLREIADEVERSPSLLVG